MKQLNETLKVAEKRKIKVKGESMFFKKDYDVSKLEEQVWKRYEIDQVIFPPLLFVIRKYLLYTYISAPPPPFFITSWRVVIVWFVM